MKSLTDHNPNHKHTIISDDLFSINSESPYTRLLQALNPVRHRLPGPSNFKFNHQPCSRQLDRYLRNRCTDISSPSIATPLHCIPPSVLERHTRRRIRSSRLIPYHKLISRADIVRGVVVGVDMCEGDCAGCGGGFLVVGQFWFNWFLGSKKCEGGREGYILVRS